jgi:MFS family permease
MTTYTSQAESAGCVAVLIPGIAGLVTAAVLIGVGVGLITPIGFAYLAATAPEERLGKPWVPPKWAVNSAGGPLLVGALAAAITLTPALLVFGGVLTATAGLIAAPNRRTQDPSCADPAT